MGAISAAVDDVAVAGRQVGGAAVVQFAIGNACLFVMWFKVVRCCNGRLQEGQKAQEAGGRQLFHDESMRSKQSS